MLWSEKELMNYASKKGIDNGKNIFLFLLVFILIFLGFIKKLKFFKIFETAFIFASRYGHTEIVKILVEQEGIDINTKNEIYFNNLMFHNNI